MYQLFKGDLDSRNFKLDSTQFLNVQRMLTKQVSRIKIYYRESNYVVEGNHLLNQLLLNLNVSTERDLESYVRICGYETERLARVFKLVNPVVNNPDARIGEFYNKDTKEFIILHSEEFDYQKAYDNWTKIVPVKVHAHNFTDIDCRVADGKYINQSSEGGYSVISINVPMLALQYKAWKDKVQSKQEIKTQTVNFVYQYPLLNMMDRQLELAIINRLINQYSGKPVSEFKAVHPVSTSDLTPLLDRVAATRINTLKSGNYKFDQMFTMFYGLKRRTWQEVIRPIDIAPVRSVKWVLELQTLKYFEFFVQVRKDRGGSYNNTETTRVLRDIKNLNNDSAHFKTTYRDLTTQLDNLKMLIDLG